MVGGHSSGAGLALRVRNACFFRGVTPGVYLFVGDATFSRGAVDTVQPSVEQLQYFLI